MSNFVSLLLAFSVFGNSLLFWPIYRLLHPEKTERRQRLLAIFAIALCLYTGLTGFVAYGIYHINHFHHAFLLVYAVYLLLDIGCWIASLVTLKKG